jgi:hypothetical protein
MRVRIARCCSSGGFADLVVRLMFSADSDVEDEEDEGDGQGGGAGDEDRDSDSMQSDGRMDE